MRHDTLEQFCEKLAAKTPTPGGGSGGPLQSASAATIEINPENYRAYNSWGFCLIKIGDIIKAKDILQNITENTIGTLIKS